MSSASLPTTAKKNVETIASVEQELRNRRTRVEAIGDWVAGFFGSLRFLAAHGLLITVWIVLNTWLLQGARAFDPYPFPLLGVVIGVEFIFLTTFVLMNQRLQLKRQEQWSHLTLQVCLLTEQEVTKNLQMLQQICHRLGLETLGPDRESSELARRTPVTALAAEIEKAREVGEKLMEKKLKTGKDQVSTAHGEQK